MAKVKSIGIGDGSAAYIKAIKAGSRNLVLIEKRGDGQFYLVRADGVIPALGDEVEAQPHGTLAAALGMGFVLVGRLIRQGDLEV